MVTRDKLMRIILIAASILIIIGVVLMRFMFRSFQTGDVIKLYLEDGKTEAIGFSDLSLVPGDSKEYHVKLTASPAGKYDIKLSFAEEVDKGLKNFVHVKLIADDMVLCDQLLADAFENDELVMPADFRKEKYADLTIIYYMPIEVGNEAKNVEAIFSLLFRLTD